MPWYGHVLRRNEEVGIRGALEFEVEGVTGRGRSRLGWREQGERVKAGLQDVEASNRCDWRRGIFWFHHKYGKDNPRSRGRCHLNACVYVCVVGLSQTDNLFTSLAK